MPIEPLIRSDPEHPCPICGYDTELVSETFTSYGEHGDKHQVEVGSPVWRCANLKCPGHSDGLSEFAHG
jgi:hypothetical protein